MVNLSIKGVDIFFEIKFTSFEYLQTCDLFLYFSCLFPADEDQRRRRPKDEKEMVRKTISSTVICIHENYAPFIS
jgi:hypothetical protein